jgi:hypothetical protein
MAASARQLLEPYLAGAERPNGDIDMICPLHDDARRSAVVNFKTREWNCFASCGGGTLDLLLKQRAEWLPANREPGTTSSNGDKRPFPDSARLDGWQSALLGNSDLLEWLEIRRGLNPDTLQRYGIGWNGQRFTIPVYDDAGKLVNIRQYSHTLDPKMKNWPGWGSPPRLYPINIFLDDPKEVMICEGELDALICNQQGLPAVTGTSGAKSTGRWRENWSDWFKGLTVYVCFDRDADGRRATRRIVDKLSNIAGKLLVIDLPYPMGSRKDLTDFFIDGGTISKLKKLAKPISEVKDELLYTPADYEELRSGNMEGKSVEVVGTLASIFSTQILLPRSLEARCNYDWDPKRCAVCPVGQRGGDLKTPIGESHELHLELLGASGSVEKRNQLFRRASGAPHNCPKVDVRATYHSAWDCEIRNGSNLAEEAYPVVLRHEGKPPGLNQAYRFRGKLRVAPRGQRAIFMATECEPAVQDLDSFSPGADDVERAQQWVARFAGTPDERLEQISEQLEYHVTEIYGQRLLHMATDLVYHSVLHFRFGGSVVTRGWMELLAVGETRSGKSTTASKLLDLYQRGHYQSSENASVAGLLFGVDKRLGSGRETWGGSVGVLPLNNRGLVALDEAQGLRTEQIAQMSDMRSRGVVQVSKIRAAEVQAQVRLLWLANGRRARYANGIDALRDQMGQAEDLARVDIPLYIKGNVGKELDKAQKTYGGLDDESQEVLRWLVLWAWSRKADDVRWTRPARTAIWKHSKALSSDFTTTVPIFQPNEAGVRLARMAVALAARLFSTKDGHRLIVKSEHIEAARRLYERFLGARELGLVEIKKHEELVEHAGENYGGELREFLQTAPINVRQQLMNGELAGFGLGAVDAGGIYINKLSGMHAVTASGGKYEVAPWAVEIARSIT